jgi:Ca2+-binding EF-hand superfamily protein
MIELPNVFCLLTLPNKHACEGMETVKNRPKGKKNFGVCIGHLENFVNLIEEGAMPLAMRSNRIDHFELFKNSHLNVIMTEDRDFNTIMVRDGSLQGYLSAEGSPHRKLFKYLEDGLKDMADLEMFNGKAYTAVAGTSANISHQGSITEWDDAKEFGAKTKIPLVIRRDSEENRNARLGSYTSFKIRQKEISVLRYGSIFKEIINQPKLQRVLSSFAKGTIDRLSLLDVGGTSINELYKRFQSTHKYKDGFLERDELGVFLNKLVAVDGDAVNGAELDTFYNASAIVEDRGGISFSRFIVFVDNTYEGKSPQLRLLESKVSRVFGAKVQSVIKRKDENALLTVDNLSEVFRFWDRFRDRAVESVGKHEIVAFLSMDDSNDDVDEYVSSVEMEVLFEFMREEENGVISFDELLRFLEDCVHGGDIKESSPLLKSKEEIVVVAAAPMGGEEDVDTSQIPVENPEHFSLSHTDIENSNAVSSKEEIVVVAAAPMGDEEDVDTSQIPVKNPEHFSSSQSKTDNSPKTVVVENSFSTTTRSQTMMLSRKKVIAAIPTNNFSKQKNYLHNNQRLNRVLPTNHNRKTGREPHNKHISLSDADSLHNRLISHKQRVVAKLARMRAERDEREKNLLHFEVNYRRYS